MPSNSLNNNQIAGSSSGDPADDPRLNIREELAGEWDTELLFLSEEEFDEAIIGVAERIGDEPVVAYDTTKIVEILSRSMSVDEAYEFFEFNILGAYVGQKTPMFITTAFKQ
jgi:hypothetical protein